MVRRDLLLATLTIAALCASCGHNKRAMKTVTSAAAFELDCPEEDLTLTVLSADGPRQLAKQIGVEGCDQRLVYVYFASTDTWIATSAVTPEMRRQEADFKEQRAHEEQAFEEQRRLEQQGSYQRGTSE